MATPGWYPDPAGQPGAFRYWDGSAWGEELRGDPFGAPPAGAAPHPPGPPASANLYDQPTVLPGTQPPTPQPAYQQPNRPAWEQPGREQPVPTGGGRTAVIVVIAVVLAALLGAASFLLVRSLTDGPDSSAPWRQTGPATT